MQFDDSIFILIVEHDQTTQAIFRGVFENIRQHFNPKIYPLFATNGADAITQFKQHDVQLVMLNYGLPGGMFGDELAIELRKIKKVPTIWRSMLGSYRELDIKSFPWDGEFPEHGIVTTDVVVPLLKNAGISYATANTIRVLYVEDQPILRKMFAVKLRMLTAPDIGALNHYRFELTLAENGKRAIKEFKQQAFDVVLMDFELGSNMDGVDVARALKIINAKPYFIWHSSHPDPAKATDKFFDWDAKLAKPSQDEALIAVFEQAIKKVK